MPAKLSTGGKYVPAQSLVIPDNPILAMDVEDFVAALFQAAGYFVEKNIVERDEGEDILELDAVATDYHEERPTCTIAEAKSGADSGYPVAFKILGWMRYLGVSRGALFTSRATHDVRLMNERLNPHGVSYTALGNCSDAAAQFAAAGFRAVRDPELLDVWRLSYGIERRLLHDLTRLVKSNKDKQAPRVVRDYISLIRDKTFFEPDIRTRVGALYDAFQEHPKLARGCALESEGKSFDAVSDGGSLSSLAAAMYDGEFPLVQMCFYAEHRARLALLKAAIDYHDITEAGALPGVAAGETDWTALLSMPGSFRTALHDLSQEPQFRRYALFWQVLLWGFGGFLLADRLDEEYGALSEQTGIPVAEVPRALQAFDKLFPHSGSWLTSSGWSSLRVVKMFPYPMRMVGAVQRMRMYSLKQYGDLAYGDYTVKDLVRWHNKGIEFWNRPRPTFSA